MINFLKKQAGNFLMVENSLDNIIILVINKPATVVLSEIKKPNHSWTEHKNPDCSFLSTHRKDFFEMIDSNTSVIIIRNDGKIKIYGDKSSYCMKSSSFNIKLLNEELEQQKIAV